MIRDLWPAILAMAAATYLTRSFTLVLFPTFGLPAVLQRGLRYMPIGVLVALVVPTVAAPGGRFLPPWDNPDLLAAVATWVVARRTHSLIRTVAAGVGSALLLRRLF